MDAKADFRVSRSQWLVSIHAPVMDAKDQLYEFSEFARFNPRARDGRESSSFNRSISKASFNPRARDGRERLCQYRH